MRGSPLLRSLAAFILILIAGIPLWRLTQEVRADRPVTPPEAVLEQKAIHLHLSFTTLPSAVKVLHLGQALWEEKNPTIEMERDLAIPCPKEGIDLQFELTWPAEPLAAMRIQLTDPEGREHDKSVWGRGETSEVVTFP